MQTAFFQDLYNILINDPALQAVYAPAPVRARFNLANQDEDFPYLIYSGNFQYDDSESFACGTAFITVSVYDFRTNSARCLAACNAVKNALNRHLYQNPGQYRVTRWYLGSQMNIPMNREDVYHEELIFRVRFYDESLSSQVT